MLACDTFIMLLKLFKLWKLPTVVGSIMLVGVLTCCALLHLMCDLKPTKMNVQCSLIQELMLHEFKLDHKAVKTTKNIFNMKGEGSVDHHNTVIKFCSACKNLIDQAKSSRAKIMDSEAMLQAIEVNPVNCTQRVSSKDKKVHIFANVCCPKVNTTACLEFKPTYYDDEHTNHSTTGILSPHPTNIREVAVISWCLNLLGSKPRCFNECVTIVNLSLITK